MVPVLTVMTYRRALIKFLTLRSCRLTLNALFVLDLIRGNIARPVRSFELQSFKYYRSDNVTFRLASKNFNECYHALDLSESTAIKKQYISELLSFF